MWKFFAFLITISLAYTYFTACQIKSPKVQMFMPCISLHEDPNNREGCGCKWEHRATAADTANYRDAFFERHKETGRSFWKLVE
jgi:hypothetical protein